ncbi:MAG: SIS domain-containing protein [Dehalococcoidia bacterium]
MTTFDPDHERHILLAREVIKNEARALDEAAANIGHDFVEAVEMIATSHGALGIIGVGKSGHVARKLSSTFASTGTPATFLHAGDVVHGDLGGLHKGDTVMIISHSGETPEIVALLPMVKRMDLPIIAITDGARSTLALVANIVVVPGNVSRADPIGLAPTASSAAALAIGDAMALAVAQHHGYTTADFEHKPGGALGRLMESVYRRPSDG